MARVGKVPLWLEFWVQGLVLAPPLSVHEGVCQFNTSLLCLLTAPDYSMDVEFFNDSHVIDITVIT